MWIDFSQYYMFWVCCPVVLLCLLGFCRAESFWTILILPFCLFFATFFAIGYYQPLANILDGFMPSLSFYNDITAFLVIYTIVFAINVYVTKFLSRINLFFPPKVNLIGNYSVLAVTFLVFYFCIVPIFFYLVPEGPPRKNFDNITPMPQFSLYERLSGSSLQTINGRKEDKFDFLKFYEGEIGKNAIVYSQVLKVSGDEKAKGDEWKLKSKSSPNVSKKQNEQKDKKK